MTPVVVAMSHDQCGLNVILLLQPAQKCYILSNLAVFATNVQDDVSESQIRPKSQHSNMETNCKSVPNVY